LAVVEQAETGLEVEEKGLPGPLWIITIGMAVFFGFTALVMIMD
jgi:hypothetical protein